MESLLNVGNVLKLHYHKNHRFRAKIVGLSQIVIYGVLSLGLLIVLQGRISPALTAGIISSKVYSSLEDILEQYASSTPTSIISLLIYFSSKVWLAWGLFEATEIEVEPIHALKSVEAWRLMTQVFSAADVWVFITRWNLYLHGLSLLLLRYCMVIDVAGFERKLERVISKST